MLKFISIATILLSCVRPGENTVNTTQNNAMSNYQQDTATSIHSFKVEAIDGGTINFADFKGKKILIVNTASQCGYTPQYKELEALYNKYKEKLIVVGFPANNFGQQEPGSNTEIKSFCQKNYGVSFPLAAKISVKGNDMAPIYRWLTQKQLNGVLDAEIKWNFNKFLLDENGRVIAKFESGTNPLSKDITGRL
jgi:glutathione peroxidase